MRVTNYLEPVKMHDEVSVAILNLKWHTDVRAKQICLLFLQNKKTSSVETSFSEFQRDLLWNF